MTDATMPDPWQRPTATHNLTLHLVWCPRRRQPLLTGPVADRLRQLIRHKARQHNWTIVLQMVMPDHVHLCLIHGPTVSASYIAHQFRGFTSQTLQQEFPQLRQAASSLWSPSFFVASAGAIPSETVQRFIDNQWKPEANPNTPQQDTAPDSPVPVQSTVLVLQPIVRGFSSGAIPRRPTDRSR